MSELKDFYIQDVMDMHKYLAKMHRGGLSDFSPAVITCAITGMQQSKEKNEYLPVTFEEQAQTCKEVFDAGASMVHIHVRDQKNTNQPASDPADFLTVNKMVRKLCPEVIINNTVGGGYLRIDNTGSLGKMSDVAKTSLAEVATVDVEGMGQGVIGGVNLAYTITPGEMDRLCTTLLENGTIPEFECFDIGDLIMVQQMIATGKLGKGPYLVDLIVNPGCNFQSPSYLIEAMRYVPDNSIVTAICTGAGQWPLLAVAISLGLNIRVGMEDNIYLNRGVRAKSNKELVEKAVQLCELMGRKVATVKEAREMYNLITPRTYEG